MVPARDKLREARIGADIVHPLATTLDASISMITGFCERLPTDDSKPSIPYRKMRRSRIREEFKDLAHRPDLSIPQILAWADAHHGARAGGL